MGHPPQGPPLDLTARVNASTGRLDWTAPGPGWQLHALFDGPTGMKVKRAAPGGEGLVVDQLSATAVPTYLRGFDQAFRAGGPPGVRAFTSDSFEDMGSDFTPDFLAAFAARRGYDLRLHLPALAGEGDPEVATRVLADYRETVSDLLLERGGAPVGGLGPHPAIAGAQPGPRRARRTCWISYAAADIPETEAFGPSHFPFPACTPSRTCPRTSASRTRCSPSWPPRPRTWPAGRWSPRRAPPGWASISRWRPSQVKPELDKLFLAGVNHVFLHGVTYSPADAPWPGWLFYASTDFGPESGFWRAMPALSAYVARTQAMLQTTQPDRDLLVYFPMHDLWHEARAGVAGTPEQWPGGWCT